MSNNNSEGKMKLFIKNMWSLVSNKEKHQFIYLILLMIVSSVLEACGISSVIPILSVLLDKDFMYENSYAVTLCKLFHINTYAGFIFICVAGLLDIFIVKNIFLLVKNNYHAKCSLNFETDVRKRAFQSYLKTDYRYYLDHNSADITKTLFDDVSNTYLSFDSLLIILTESIISLFLAVAVFIIDWKISIGILCVIAVIFFVITKAIRPAVKRSGEVAYQSIKIRNRWIKQSIEGIKTVIITQKTGFFEEKEYESDLEFANAEKRHKVLGGLPRIAIELLSVTFIVVFTGALVLSGEDFEPLIPKLGAIGLAALKLLPGMNTIVSNIVSIQYRMPFVQRITELLRDEPKEPECGVFPDKFDKEIKIENVSFRYSEDRRMIMDNASLVIPIGKMIGVIGTSGEGKTTFLDLLMGLLPTDKGEISVDGVNVFQNITAWRSNIGYITQNTFLLDDSIFANVAFGLDDDEVDEEKVWLALEKSQISDFVKELPDGIHTEIGERGVRLSGGQCQRIGIARALYNNPQILIFDEATSSLDSATEKAVVEAINSLYGKHTIIVVAHRSVALEHCDKIYQIRDGKFYETRM